MKLVAWNIRHGGFNHSALASALLAHEPDMIVLGEYRASKSEPLVEQLRTNGVRHVAASAVTGITNGVAILSRLPIEPQPAPLGASPFDKWSVAADVPRSNLSVIGVYAPLPNSWGSSPQIHQDFWGGSVFDG